MNGVHHVVTLGLLWFSWSANFVRIGALVLAVHDMVNFAFALPALPVALERRSSPLGGPVAGGGEDGALLGLPPPRELLFRRLHPRLGPLQTRSLPTLVPPPSFVPPCGRCRVVGWAGSSGRRCWRPPPSSAPSPPTSSSTPSSSPSSFDPSPSPSPLSHLPPLIPGPPHPLDCPHCQSSSQSLEEWNGERCFLPSPHSPFPQSPSPTHLCKNSEPIDLGFLSELASFFSAAYRFSTRKLDRENALLLQNLIYFAKLPSKFLVNNWLNLQQTEDCRSEDEDSGDDGEKED